MSAELFLEIGTEEIPAGFLPTAMADLERLIRKELETGRIGFETVRTFATPRRLVLAVTGVASGQARQEVTASGPSVSVAFDADGNPTKAALGFARSNGVEVSDLERRETDKGEYLFVSKVVEGRPTGELLPEMLPRIIAAIPFKKSMRWKDLDIRFARPMHWIVALFDGQVVPFSYGNLTSGNLSYGHRFMAPDAFEVSSLEQYLVEAEKHFVIVDPVKRRQIISDQLAEVVGRCGGKLNPDDDLLDEVAFLVEYPAAVMGGFEDSYLQLPPELLITVMREHQRYFTVVDDSGKLLPRFITISNTRAEDLTVVQQGNERVLRARLSDAMFFWNEDRKVKLESRLDALKNVVYQAKLGTSYEKVMRFKTLAVELAQQQVPEVVELTERAASLAKCDLETGMVFEFTELQGVMGREYALLDGEDPRVARAIFEHYLPVQAGGELPGDDVGAFVSIADKIDSICGCFGVGLIPTGTADPFALRRSAIGILNIILDRGYRLSLPALVERSLGLLADKLTRPATEVAADVLEFLRLRFFNMLTAQGLPNDVVDAVLSAAFEDPVDALQRVKGLASFREEGEFEALAVTFKRVVNIVKGGVDTSVDSALFEADCEAGLFDALQNVTGRFEQFVAEGAYLDALRTVGGLRSPVDALFEGVMVMSPDEAVKTNRLALLTAVARLFQGIADFSKIAA
ncbi:glycyl-tRNA synthetase, beta subunit [Syntrophotalea carbinolica DSM 2380]|uniref:Glycine--tRNA ligase beta subunit n=1 Tax=Syntrophotalea carbinolica (strain DSM 2380 / NBRC 103641 / GraBd1) TaxID=338963 RepID=SYGB_SYNC1|nr:glycine--tRNA ligase subunit beta [Syntrophotalea carbinolica]Q3A8N5.1 RecName: Full=Glycine--tRNA ligase beta subunit; AltName: Full=Glycyl-tRNA synthetase beta subunit; Short=GlyRS [Syntrophotalea carbinolica DSM 2380]ABA87858.1 glycyl-tRNA synthetase, beta subunit [Syntrophotalea carbinolica DSM 2380]